MVADFDCVVLTSENDCYTVVDEAMKFGVSMRVCGECARLTIGLAFTYGSPNGNGAE